MAVDTPDMAEMAATPIIEFVVTKFKPDATVEQEGTQAHKTWQEILVLLRGVVGIKKNYWGRQLEDPSLVLHVLSEPPAPPWRRKARQAPLRREEARLVLGSSPIYAGTDPRTLQSGPRRRTIQPSRPRRRTGPSGRA